MKRAVLIGLALCLGLPFAPPEVVGSFPYRVDGVGFWLHQPAQTIFVDRPWGDTATTLRADGVDSWYNLLQASVEKRLAKNVALTAAYTWSRSIDFTSNNGDLGNPLILEYNKAVANFDRNTASR
jgi:hypothetical protein